MGRVSVDNELYLPYLLSIASNQPIEVLVMARSNLAAVATDETEAQAAETETAQAEAPAKRRRGKRGPMVFYVAYKVIGPDGQPAEGYRAKFLRVEKDKESVTRRVLNGEKIDDLMVVTVPLNNQGEADTSQAQAQAEAA